MSISFYYVVTYNVQHKTVKKLLDKIQFSAISGSLIELKTRSQLYHDYETVKNAAEDDFELKLKMMYNQDQSEQVIKCVTATNPIFDPDCEDSAYDQGEWDDWCAGSLFFAESDDEDEESENIEPASWMIKYELFYIEDAIEVTHNGEAVYAPGNNLTNSSYH